MSEELIVYNNENELAETKQDDFASKFNAVYDKYPNISDIHKEYIKWKIYNHGKTYSEMAAHFNRNENYLTQVMNRWDIKSCKDEIIGIIDNEKFAVLLSEMKNISINDDKNDINVLNDMLKDAKDTDAKLDIIKTKKKITTHYTPVPKEVSTTQNTNVNIQSNIDLPYKPRN